MKTKPLAITVANANLDTSKNVLSQIANTLSEDIKNLRKVRPGGTLTAYANAIAAVEEAHLRVAFCRDELAGKA